MNAESTLTGTSSRIRGVRGVGVPIDQREMNSRAPVARSPEPTTNSEAIVITLVFENPESASFTDSTPASTSASTAASITIAGFHRSAASAAMTRTRMPRVIASVILALMNGKECDESWRSAREVASRAQRDVASCGREPTVPCHLGQRGVFRLNTRRRRSER